MKVIRQTFKQYTGPRILDAYHLRLPLSSSAQDEIEHKRIRISELQKNLDFLHKYENVRFLPVFVIP